MYLTILAEQHERKDNKTWTDGIYPMFNGAKDSRCGLRLYDTGLESVEVHIPLPSGIRRQDVLPKTL